MAPSPHEPQQVSDETKQKYADILKANGILDSVKSVTAHEPEELKGEHMATGSLYVHVEFEDPSKKPKNLFVKHFLDNPAHTEMMKGLKIMAKETSFFTEFLPDARELCKKYPGCEKNLDCFPKCLYADDDIVVLENIVLDDTYVMLPKEDLQDLYTAKFVLENLAKFHASTFVMIGDQGPENFRKKYELIIFEALFSEGNPFVTQMLDSGINTCLMVLNGHEVEGGADTIATLSSYLGKSMEMTQRSVTYNPEDKINVINHGDFWNNNMMFKKDPETGKVVQHLFVDLQCTRMGSPNVDIGYFLYTSVKPTIRRNHLEELLQHYYDAFEKTLATFGKACPITFEDFFSDYKTRIMSGFFIHFNILFAIGVAKHIDMTEMQMSDDPNEMMEMFTNVIKKWMKNNRDEVSKIAKEIVAVTNEFLDLTSIN